MGDNSAEVNIVEANDFTEGYCTDGDKNRNGDINAITAFCGMILGAAVRKDGGSSLIFAPNSTWSMPMYSCASSAKAIIKTVHFRYNGTDDFASFAVTNVKEKKYAQTSEEPLWAVENTGATLNNVNPLWGIVSPEHESNPNLTTKRKASLWLPGYRSGASLGAIPYNDILMENIPGVTFYSNALKVAYSIDSRNSLNAINGMTDYSGKTNLAIYAKLQSLSREASSAARIINLIWTDIAANAVVGTHGWVSRLSPSGTEGKGRQLNLTGEMRTELVPVTRYHRSVRYHFPYAVPAIIALAISLCILILVIAFWLLGRSYPSRVG